MPEGRDRHDRGMRGPIALPNSLTNRPVPLRALAKAQLFNALVLAGISTLSTRNPKALERVDVGVEDVPAATYLWADTQVPLAAAIGANDDQPAQIVFFRRPIERRARTRADLEILIYRTLLEQLSALTGEPVESIDPLFDWNEF